MVFTVALKLPQEENAWLTPALIGLALAFLQLPFWMYLIKVSFGKIKEMYAPGLVLAP